MFKLTENQQLQLDFIRNNNRVQNTTSAKWIIEFNCGKGANYLTEYCHDRESAFIAAVERFGDNVKDVR